MQNKWRSLKVCYNTWYTNMAGKSWGYGKVDMDLGVFENL